MLGLLKFFLFLITGLFILRLAAPYLLKFFLQRLSKKMQQQQSEAHRNTPTKETTKDLGEYIDYEELD